jgi:hypothetical protein
VRERIYDKTGKKYFLTMHKKAARYFYIAGRDGGSCQRI